MLDKVLVVLLIVSGALFFFVFVPTPNFLNSDHLEWAKLKIAIISACIFLVTLTIFVIKKLLVRIMGPPR